MSNHTGTPAQTRAIAALAAYFDRDIQAEPNSNYTDDPDDKSLVAAWGTDDGALILDDGTIDLGGGHLAPTNNPLYDFVTAWNRGLRG